jgi:hypothetical protein
VNVGASLQLTRSMGLTCIFEPPVHVNLSSGGAEELNFA